MKSIEHSVVFDTGFLFSIQELITAGFRSRHRTVVNESIAMWNSTFGGEATLDYPEDLKNILQKLKSVTELRLPNFPESNDEDVSGLRSVTKCKSLRSQLMCSPLHFIDSQEEVEMQLEPVVSPVRPLSSIEPVQRVVESIKSVPLSPASRKAAALQASPSPARRRVKTTPKARLRHNDSQIQFAAIESSPLQVQPVESQHLTDRQREVKERQGREAAAMFPEIRSSPRSTSRPADYVLPKLVFKSAQDPTPESAMIEDISPTYPPDALMNDFLGSSPTPSSKRSSDRRSDDDPPSSPPLDSSHVQINQPADATLAREDYTLAQAIANAGNDPGKHFADETLPISKGYPANGESITAVEDGSKPTKDQEDASTLKAPQVPDGAHPASDFDIYVDAPSVISLDKPSIEHDDDPPNDIANSFQSEGSSQFSIEDEQVTAQLITEMERASSQHSAKQDETAHLAPDATKKRKRTADSPDMERKIKRTPAALDLQADAEIPRTGETVADCVMIDIREVDSLREVLPQQIKRELSASPSILMSTQAIEETPVAEQTPLVHPVISEVNQSSGQNHDSPMTAKKTVGRPRGSRNSQVKREEAEKEQASALRKGTRVSERLSGSITSSPQNPPAASQESTKGGPWVALGKTPRRGMFKWLRRSSANPEDVATQRPAFLSASETNVDRISEQEVHVYQRNDLWSADHQSEDAITSHQEDGESVANQRDGEAHAEESTGVETEGEAASAPGILQNLRNMLDNIKRVTFGAEEERAAVGLLFECVKEVHEAGRRHTTM